ncbi:trigger factor [Haliangium sp.]|uniref:trigger factor n=1 Tax=Haliangium sp. TaxID=2663208 RepID=UPI003D12C8C9
MQVRIEDVSAVEKKLIVEVPWDQVSAKLGDAYRKLSKSVQLKGFRKGKVPRSVLQRIYGKHVQAEVAESLVRESFLTATSEHQLAAVSEPKLDALPDIKRGEAFSFEALVEIRTEAEPENYDGMELTRRPLKVSDEAVDAAVEGLRREHTELMPIENREVTARTDVVTVKLEGSIGDMPVDQPYLHVDLSSPDDEPLPGLIQALAGLPIDIEDHAFELEFPADHANEQLAGKTAKLTVTIRDARFKQVPELDDEFAQDTERGETMDELRQSLREELEKKEAEQIERELRDAALKALVERNQIPVAPALVERAVEMRFHQLQHMFGMGGDHNHAPIPDDLREKMRPSALESVRGQILIEALADKEKVEVNDEDIDAYLADIAAARDSSVARVRADLAREGRLDDVQYQLRHDKVLDLLIERAVVTEAEPTPEEPADAAGAEADDSEAAGAEAAEAEAAEGNPEP